MQTLQVPGIHCGHCVERIDKALTAEQIPHTIDEAAKTVSFTGETEKVVEILDDLGFDAVLA